MSCSIDSRRGSILMEFVLVLPIYIFLFGALYLLGDMGLNAIRISTGDRDAAMDAGDRAGHSMGQFLAQEMRDEALKTSYNSQTYRADEGFKGAWSWQAAGRSLFAYRLRSYGDGLIAYPFLHYGGSSSGGGILGTLVGGGLVVFHSKDYSLSNKVRAYNYYTIKRTDLAREPNAYRNWQEKCLTAPSSGLEQYWYSCVYKEAFSDPVADHLEQSDSQGSDQLPSPPGGRDEYNRSGILVRWCQ